MSKLLKNDVIEFETAEKENLTNSAMKPSHKRNSILSYFNNATNESDGIEKDEGLVPGVKLVDSDDSDLPYIPMTKKSKSTRGHGRGSATPASSSRGCGTPKGRGTPKVSCRGGRKFGEFTTQASKKNFTRS